MHRIEFIVTGAEFFLSIADAAEQLIICNIRRACFFLLKKKEFYKFSIAV